MLISVIMTLMQRLCESVCEIDTAAAVAATLILDATERHPYLVLITDLFPGLAAENVRVCTRVIDLDRTSVYLSCPHLQVFIAMVLSNAFSVILMFFVTLCRRLRSQRS